MWRLNVEKETTEEFNETAEYVLHEIDILEKIVRKIRRYNLDIKSKNYFEFLQSTIDQMRSMLEKGRFTKRGDGYGTR